MDSGTRDFAALMLAGLTEMAARSGRRQADVAAALRRAGLSADPPLVQIALKLLQAEDCVRNLVPLSDGGVLLTVTGHALGRSYWE